MFQFKNVKCKKLYASGNRVRLVSMATCSLLFTRSHALCRFNSLVYVYFSLLIRLVAEIVDFFIAQISSEQNVSQDQFTRSLLTPAVIHKTQFPLTVPSDIQVTPCRRMSHGDFLTCTQSVTKVTLSIAMTINTPTTCPLLAFVNLWLNQCGTEGRQKSHPTNFDKNKLMYKSCSFPHNSSVLFRK